MNIDDKTIIDQITPEKLGELFACMDNNEQARFFSHVAEVASKWSFGLDFQLQYVTDSDELTLAGRRVMDDIGSYSHWGLVPRARDLFCEEKP